MLPFMIICLKCDIRWVHHDIFIPMQGQIATTTMVVEITLAAIVWNIGHVS